MPPLGQATVQSPRIESLSAKLGNRVEGQNTIRTAAVRNDLAVVIEFVQPFREILHRNIDCAGNVSGLELFNRANIQYGDETLTDTFE